MVRCSKCHEEIIGKIHRSVIYTGIWVPVVYCKHCYHELQEARESIGSIIAFFSFTTIILIILGILLVT